jgi:hypothetical protein
VGERYGWRDWLASGAMAPDRRPFDPIRAAQQAAARAARLRRRRRAAVAGFAIAAAAAIAFAPSGASAPGGGPGPGVALTEAPEQTGKGDRVPEPPAPRATEKDTVEPRRAAGEAMRMRVEAARRFAGQLPGSVSFAIADSDGPVGGYRPDRQYPSASVVKALLLAAEMWRLEEAGDELDPGTRATLTSMITFSDNEAADEIYGRVGDTGLREAAARAGLERFEVAYSWGNAEITAADMALLFSHLDAALPAENREFAKGLLGAVIPAQSWGIPAVAGDSWAVRFKGGWRPTDSGQLVHQAAELRDGERLISVAVLTDGQPSMEAGIAAIEGIAARLVPRGPSG